MSYAWDFGDGTTGSGETASHTYSSGSPAIVMLTITDDSGETGTVSAIVEPNNGPAARFTVTCQSVACQFDGSPASDPDGTIVRHVWTFGDGASAEGLMVSHTYGTPGFYPATLTVTDNEGAIGTEKQTVVAEAAPIAAFTFGCSGLVCTFDGSGFERLRRHHRELRVVFRRWSLRQRSGRELLVPLGERLRHADRPRQPRGHGQVHEIRGAPDGSAGGVLHLLVQHSRVQLDGSASSGPNPITAYTWDFGDGSRGSGRSAGHTYQAPGMYVVVLTVLDSSGRFDDQPPT